MDELFNAGASDANALGAGFFEHDDTPKPRAEGDYVMRVTGFEFKENPNTGAFGVNWALVFDDGAEYKYYTYIGRKVRGVLTETEKGFSTRAMIRALGITPETHPHVFQTGSWTLTDVVGLSVLATVKHETYERDGEELIAAKVVRVRPNVTSTDIPF